MINKYKYPSTPYHIISPDIDKDDKIIYPVIFKDKQVVISIKYDGENSSLYSDGSSHARSIDSRHHYTRDWVKRFWAERYHKLPDGWCICGENVFAKHSIFYDDLDSYFYGFSVWNDKNECLSWTETLFAFELLDITPVPVLYEGLYSDQIVKEVWNSLDITKQEGLVIRLVSSYNYDDFGKSICKLVRQNHVQEYTDPVTGEQKHWKYSQITPNKLKDSNENI